MTRFVDSNTQFKAHFQSRQLFQAKGWLVTNCGCQILFAPREQKEVNCLLKKDDKKPQYMLGQLTCLI